jgi:hypothetical protein
MALMDRHLDTIENTIMLEKIVLSECKLFYITQEIRNVTALSTSSLDFINDIFAYAEESRATMGSA